MSMRIAKRPTLFFRFFGVGFAHTFHKFYNLPSNTLISFNFFCHSTLRPPFTPIQYARGAFVTYGDSGVALLPGGNTGSGLRLLPYGQYAYAAALCRIRSIRAACAAMCSLRCAHTPRLFRPLGSIRLRGYGYCPTGNTPTRRRYFASAQYAPLARLCAHYVARIRRAFRLRRSQSKRRACVPIEARSQTFLAPREHVPANRYIHQYADANHHAQNARTTIRNERQSNPNDGCPTHDHGRIDDDLPKEYGCYPHC